MCDRRYVVGGGATEIALSRHLINISSKVNYLIKIKSRKEDSYVIESFGKALQVIPECLAANTGLDSNSTVSLCILEQNAQNSPNIGIDCISAVSRYKLERKYVI